MQRVRDWVESFPPKLKRKRSNVRHFGNKSVTTKVTKKGAAKLQLSSVDRNGNTIGSTVENFHSPISLSVIGLDYSRDCVLCSPSADDKINGNLNSSLVLDHRRSCKCRKPSDRMTSSLVHPYPMPKTCSKAPEFDYSSITLPLNRPKIRTNPWVSPRANLKSELNFSPRSLNISSISDKDILRPIALHKEDPADSVPPGTFEFPTGKLDESLCASESSGYASNDSSPETSIHSPDWQKAANLHSSSVTQEIHKEVKLLPTLFVNTCEETTQTSTASSSNDLLTTSEELAPSGDILEQLSHRLLKLSFRGRTVQQLVNMAKFEHESRMKTRHLCLEQLALVRDMKLMIHSGFEMVI